MRRIEQYEQAKPIADNLKVKDMAKYEVGKILYADIWNMYGFSRIEKLKRIAALILCNPINFSECLDSKESKNIALEIQYKGHVERIDNSTIYNNLYRYLKPSKHMILEKKYIFHPRGCLKRLVRLINYFGDIRHFTIAERLYLAAQLVMVKGLIEYLERMEFFEGYRYLLIFQEYDTISSTVIQNAHLHGVKVISPQHGMPMNRHEDKDQLFFDGFQCDYKLVWNEFEKQQYISAGVRDDRIYIVGNTKTLCMEDFCSESYPDYSSLEKTEDFGVLLNCPQNDNAFEDNCKLLEAAQILAVEKDLHFYIKLHPLDSISKYKEILKCNCAYVLEPNITMKEYQKYVKFSIAHITAAIFDLIYDGCFVFQYVMGENYPVDISSIYKFTSPEELLVKYSKWTCNLLYYKEMYQATVNKYYIKNAKERHDAFFKYLLSEEDVYRQYLKYGEG